jgi:lipopolysaccharide transport system ATP-binding protein
MVLRRIRGEIADVADSATPAVTVRDLAKRYWLQERPATFQQAVLHLLRKGSTPFWALRGISFEVDRGQSVGIIGANGAGKTTLLRLICGLGRPTNGHVHVSGHVAALLDLGAGFHPHLTGRENLYVGAIVAGLSRRTVTALFDTIVEFAELRDFIDQPLRTYSSGMQMRLAFAVAIHVDPSILVIDEALSVGDGHFQQKCLDRIARFRQRGKTLLIVSHDMQTIRSFCTRAVWLDHGTIAADGPADDVIGKYEAVTEHETPSANPDKGQPTRGQHLRGPFA